MKKELIILLFFHTHTPPPFDFMTELGSQPKPLQAALNVNKKQEDQHIQYISMKSGVEEDPRQRCLENDDIVCARAVETMLLLVCVGFRSY